MPCDRIATASAQISQATLLELLNSEPARIALQNWVLAQFPGAIVKNLTISLPDGTYIVLSPTGIRISGSNKNLAEIQNKVKTFAENLAGVSMQQRVQAALKKNFQVTESTIAPKNGALVMKIKV